MIQAKIDQVFLFSVQRPESPSVAHSCVVVANNEEAAFEVVESNLQGVTVLGVTSLRGLRDTEAKIRAALEGKPGSWPLYVAAEKNK